MSPLEEEIDEASLNDILYLITWLQKQGKNKNNNMTKSSDIGEKSKIFMENNSDEETVKKNLEKLKNMKEIYIKNVIIIFNSFLI